MEKILKIKEVESYGDNMSGFKVKTNKQEVSLMISNYQSCCEQWGYFMCNDSFDQFIGSDLLDIKITDQALNKETCKKHYDDFDFDYGGGAIFVDLVTNKGVLQFVAYNGHNGYYGHEVKISSEQLILDEYV